MNRFLAAGLALLASLIPIKASAQEKYGVGYIGGIVSAQDKSRGALGLHLGAIGSDDPGSPGIGIARFALHIEGGDDGAHTQLRLGAGRLFKNKSYLMAVFNGGFDSKVKPHGPNGGLDSISGGVLAVEAGKAITSPDGGNAVYVGGFLGAGGVVGRRHAETCGGCRVLTDCLTRRGPALGISVDGRLGKPGKRGSVLYQAVGTVLPGKAEQIDLNGHVLVHSKVAVGAGYRRAHLRDSPYPNITTGAASLRLVVGNLQ